MAIRYLHIDREPRRVIELLAEVLHQMGVFHECRLGGGTALAARWQHRKSTDLDIFCKGEAIDTLFHAGKAEIGDLLNKCIQDGIPITGNAFLNNDEILHFQIDEVPVSLGRTNEFVGARSGEAETLTGLELSSTVDILYKKLAHRTFRTQEITIRDAYDYLTAQKRDPEALVMAWNLLRDDQKDYIAKTHAKHAFDDVPVGGGRPVAFPDDPEMLVNLHDKMAKLFGETLSHNQEF